MRVLVIYDISSNEDRAKLADELKRLGLTRIQRSAFIGYVNTSRLKDLVRVCTSRAKGGEDVVHIIQLCDYDWRRIQVVGRPWNDSEGGELVVV